MSTSSATARGAKAPLTPVEKALKESLLPTDFRDVVFYAFSRRTVSSDGTIRVDRPLPIVAIASILKHTEHFSKLLTSGFAEANRDSDHVIRQSAHTGEYDYDSDSDLDESEENTELEDQPSSSSSIKSKLKDDGDAMFPVAANAQMVLPNRHQILIPNIAYRTLRACIFYIYTGKVNFLPLTSNGIQAERRLAMLTTVDPGAPPCSPRSIYRLAESYGMTELQELAYKEVTSQLTCNNIVKEAFSSFSARYDRLREHAVSYLSRNYSDPVVQESLQDVIDKIVQGELQHAGGVLRSLLGLRVAEASSSAPLPRLNTTSHTNPPPTNPIQTLPSWGAKRAPTSWYA